jgi:hypothetical protein
MKTSRLIVIPAMLLALTLTLVLSCKKSSDDGSNQPAGYRLSAVEMYTNSMFIGSAAYTYSGNKLTQVYVTFPSPLKSSSQIRTLIEYRADEISRVTGSFSEGSDWIKFYQIDVPTYVAAGMPAVTEKTNWNPDTTVYGKIRTNFSYSGTQVSQKDFSSLESGSWVYDGKSVYNYNQQGQLQSMDFLSKTGQLYSTRTYTWQNSHVVEEIFCTVDSTIIQKWVYDYSGSNMVKATVSNYNDHVWEVASFTDYAYNENGLLGSATTQNLQTGVNRTVYKYEAGTGNLRMLQKVDSTDPLWNGYPIPLPQHAFGASFFLPNFAVCKKPF